MEGHVVAPAADPCDAQREALAAIVSHPDLLRLYDDWRAGAPAGRLPARADIDVMALDYMLGHLILVDVLDDGGGAAARFRYRLIGADLAATLGLEMTGRTLDEHPDPTFREVAKRVYATVAAAGRPTAARRDSIIDGRVRRYEAIHLPLAADGRTVDMVLVGMRFG